MIILVAVIAVVAALGSVAGSYGFIHMLRTYGNGAIDPHPTPDESH